MPEMVWNNRKRISLGYRRYRIMYIPYGRQSINDDDIQAVAISNGTAALHAACFAAGIGVNVHYIPVHKHPYYQANGYADVVCEKAEELYKHMISLPLYSDLTEGEQDYVIEVVKGVVK